MTIDEAAKSIVKSVCDWIYKSESETYAIINFPSLFIHHAKSILKHTVEFGQRYQIKELKQRNINFHIEGRKLIRCNIYEERFDNYTIINHLNIEINKAIKQYYESSPEIEQKEAIIETKMLNLQALENFKF